MRLYHFVNASHGLENIRRRRLKVATFGNLNDPFELHGLRIARRTDRVQFEKWCDEWATQFGILCFSENWRNPVQWSHYADCHRGLCLGFDVKDDQAQSVVYVPERIGIDFGDIRASGGIDRALVMKILTHKFYHWAYEQERRAFVSLLASEKVGALYFEPFSADVALRSVHIGTRSQVTGAQVREALGDDLGGKVRIVTTRLAFNTYEVCEQRDRKRQR